MTARAWLHGRSGFKTALKSDHEAATGEAVLRTSAVKIFMGGMLIIFLIAAAIVGIHRFMVASEKSTVKPVLEDCHTVRECAALMK
ncbi:hypothetical protein W02_31720 [Nitrospira sp. KM1]|uniref:hypothetical protein n=1 Tax=Nitrospira sp. KM1 TaxID=1936990 RepID=UPI0013A7A29F|nr:hypothetical protein [Nitrospira sp. KM1]BCA56032.1 hypothetical protein W02_31720 [Nitrospira sp. KM1]